MKSNYNQILINKLLTNPYSKSNISLLQMLKIFDSNPCLITFINLHSFQVIEKECDIIEHFDYFFIDGILLKWLLEKSNKVKLRRISFDMTSLAKQFFDFAINERKTVYIIGGKTNDIIIAIKNILYEYKHLDIVGFHSGYFKNKAEENNTILEIISKSPNIVIAGMGSPLQEHFLISLRKKGWGGLGFTCGAFIKQTAKNLYYYPRAFNKYHLRWLYRIIDEPKLLPRYFLEYPKELYKLTYYKK